MAQINLTLDNEVLKGLFTAEGKDALCAVMNHSCASEILRNRIRIQ